MEIQLTTRSTACERENANANFAGGFLSRLFQRIACMGFAAALSTIAAVPAAAQCSPSSPCVTTPLGLGALGGEPATRPYSSANGVNADGSVVVGLTSIGSGFHAFRWTSAGGMVDLGTLGSNVSSATAVNSDGSVIVGYSNTPVGFGHAFRWTAATGMTDIGTLGGRFSSANGVNSDGTVVVGQSDIAAAWPISARS
jgi:probable HAF family extracellular repeat protein